MIGASSLGPGSFQHHLVVRERKQAQAKRTLLVALSLTAMVDMFAVLVIFLLQSFSAAPELVLSKGVELPKAMSGSEIKDAPVLALVGGDLFLDQDLVGPVKETLNRPTKLMARLKAARESWQKLYPDRDFPGEINLQADQSISSAVIGQVMGIVAQAHYYSIQLAVLAKESR